jgi:hypothetical protein
MRQIVTLTTGIHTCHQQLTTGIATHQSHRTGRLKLNPLQVARRAQPRRLSTQIRPQTQYQKNDRKQTSCWYDSLHSSAGLL